MKPTRRATAAKLPRFQSDEAFIRLVETHDLADYWAEFQEVKPLPMVTGLVRSIDRRARRRSGRAVS